METVTISARIPKTLYAKIVEKQEEAESKTGMKPTVSIVVKHLLEEHLLSKPAKKKKP